MADAAVDTEKFDGVLQSLQQTLENTSAYSVIAQPLEQLVEDQQHIYGVEDIRGNDSVFQQLVMLNDRVSQLMRYADEQLSMDEKFFNMEKERAEDARRAAAFQDVANQNQPAVGAMPFMPMPAPSTQRQSTGDGEPAQSDGGLFGGFFNNWDFTDVMAGGVAGGWLGKTLLKGGSFITTKLGLGSLVSSASRIIPVVGTTIALGTALGNELIKLKDNIDEYQKVRKAAERNRANPETVAAIDQQVFDALDINNTNEGLVTTARTEEVENVVAAQSPRTDQGEIIPVSEQTDAQRAETFRRTNEIIQEKLIPRSIQISSQNAKIFEEIARDPNITDSQKVQVQAAVEKYKIGLEQAQQDNDPQAEMVYTTHINNIERAIADNPMWRPEAPSTSTISAMVQAPSIAAPSTEFTAPTAPQGEDPLLHKGQVASPLTQYQYTGVPQYYDSADDAKAARGRAMYNWHGVALPGGAAVLSGQTDPSLENRTIVITRDSDEIRKLAGPTIFREGDRITNDNRVVVGGREEKTYNVNSNNDSLPPHRPSS